jgi:glutamine amidotransferase
MSEHRIAVIDYGLGNLLSVQRGLERCGATVIVTSDHETILAAPKVVLPGVGAFRNAMHELHRLGLVDVVRQLARNKIPLLGICLGMQLLLDESEEFGTTAGLGLIAGRVSPLPSHTVSGDRQQIPHIGWNALYPGRMSPDWSGTILRNNTAGDAVYFVHSFMAEPTDSVHRVADCNIGGHNVSAVIGHANIMGCQFHPEKSGEIGLKILQTFLNY